MARRARNSAPSRSASTVSHAPPRPAPPPPAPRSAAAAHPPVAHHAPPPPAVHQPQQPGMFAQMASTAAGVAVGSAVGHTLGHGLTSMFGGGSSNNAQQVPPAAAAPVESYVNQAASNPAMGASCEPDLKAYLKCMETSNNDPQTCNYYFEMLKACQTRFA
ncbi:hypothetical protein RI367_006078 [Sorochytrium milnesiophthora]